MKRDIRELFKEEEPSIKLPENHEKEFLAKLEGISVKKTTNYTFLKIVASIVVVFSLGFYFKNQRIPVEIIEEEPNIVAEFKKMEKVYTRQIDSEWKQLIETTDNRELVYSYQKKLNRLQANYTKISKEFNENPNNILALEELILNLKRRVNVLKQIQEHIELIKQTPESYETIIL